MRNLIWVLGLVVLFVLTLLAGRFLFSPPQSEPAKQEPSEVAKPSTEKPITAATGASAETPAAKNETPPPAGVSFAPATHDFGNLLEGEARNCVLKIERPVGSVFKTGRPYSTCTCVVASISKHEFAAKEEASVNVDLHSLTLEGHKSFFVYLEVLEPAKGLLKAEVTADVKRVPAKIAIVPETMSFGSVKGDKTATVKVLNLTHKPMTLGTPLCSLENVKVSIVEGGMVNPGQSATVSAQIAGAALKPGPIQGMIVLQSDSTEHMQIGIPLDGTVLANTAAAK